MNQVIFDGTELREQRERLGLSLQQVHEESHVPLDHLHALESSDVKALPSSTYAVGFLKSYCLFLRLDPEPFIEQFRASIKPQTSGRLLSALSDTSSENGFSFMQLPWVNEVLTWGTVCALVLLGWFAYSTIVSPFIEDDGQRVEAGNQEIEATSDWYEKEF